MIISKILERTVAAQLESHLQSNDIYEHFQSGFRPKHSTETALVKVINYLLLAAYHGFLSILILLDISAAFDTISHSVLLERLTCIGIADNALLWFSSYLSDKKQFVQIKNIQSDSVSVTHGVPQGSVLSPLLSFIFYLLVVFFALMVLLFTQTTHKCIFLQNLMFLILLLTSLNVCRVLIFG